MAGDTRAASSSVPRPGMAGVVAVARGGGGAPVAGVTVRHGVCVCCESQLVTRAGATGPAVARATGRGCPPAPMQQRGELVVYVTTGGCSRQYRRRWNAPSHLWRGATPAGGRFGSAMGVATKHDTSAGGGKRIFGEAQNIAWGKAVFPASPPHACMHVCQDPLALILYLRGEAHGDRLRVGAAGARYRRKPYTLLSLTPRLLMPARPGWPAH